MKLTPDQVKMLVEELDIDERNDNPEWKAMVKQLRAANAKPERIFRHAFSLISDESLYEIPVNASHYSLSLEGGPGIIFWQINEPKGDAK